MRCPPEGRRGAAAGGCSCTASNTTMYLVTRVLLAAAVCAPVRGHISSTDVSDSASMQHAPGEPPPSPCPRVFQYEPSPSGATGWAGVVRLQTPPRFSSLRLSVHLASPEHLPADPAPGTLTLRGGVAQARALVRAVHRGHRMTVEFVAEFSAAVTSVPTLLNVTVNGRLFCASQEPAGTRSTITLVSDLDTGLDSARAPDEDFGIAPELDVVAVGRPGQYAQGAAAAPPRAWTSAPAPPLPPASAAPAHLFIPQDAFRPDSFVLPSVDHSPPTAPAAPPYAALPAEEASAAGVTWRLPERDAPESSAAMRTAPPNTPPPENPPPHTPIPDTPLPHTPPWTSPGATDTDRSPLHRTHQEECGRAWSGANPLVTRGAAAVRGRWPWLVALFKKLGRRDQVGLNFECGASLVSGRHVITAAHCVEVRARRGRPSRPVEAAVLVVYLGKHDLLSYTEPGQQTAEVDSVLMHPDYAAARPSASSSGSSSSSSTSSYDNDIALLVLTEAVEPSRQIRPVCLWEEALGHDLSAVVGQVGAVPGWGKDDTGAISNEIRVANMPIVSQEACLRSNIFFHAFTTDTTFCAGFRNGTSVCNGDSGGGLFLRGADGRWRLRGIVSVSMFSVNEQACDAYNYAVFTDVAKFMPWLRERMAST